MSASIQSITDLPIDLLCYGIGDWVKKYRRYQQKYNDTRDQFESVIKNSRKKVIDTIYKNIEMREPHEMTYNMSRLVERFPSLQGIDGKLCGLPRPERSEQRFSRSIGRIFA